MSTHQGPHKKTHSVFWRLLAPNTVGFWKGQDVEMIMELYNEGKAQVHIPYGPTTHSSSIEESNKATHYLPSYSLDSSTLYSPNWMSKDIDSALLKQSQTYLLLMILICWAKLSPKCRTSSTLLSSSVTSMEWLNTTKSKVLARLTTPTLTYNGTPIPQKLN